MSEAPHNRGWVGRHIFNHNTIYVLIAAVTIILPVLIHSSKAPECANWGHIHLPFFHSENWSLGWFKVWDQTFHFEGTEIWELFAILQAAAFSILLIFEPEEGPGIRKVFFAFIFIIISCLAGIITLGFHITWAYQVAVFLTLACFTRADYLMLRLTKLIQYKMAIFLVDIPIFLALVFLTIHIGIPMKCDHHEFFSGAIAFQLIFGNTVLFIIRLSDRLFVSDNGGASPINNNPAQTDPVNNNPAQTEGA